MEAAIELMNHNFRQAFSKFPGIKVFGMAQSLTRKSGTASETIPALVNVVGDGKWVGIDDISPLIIYHKTVSPMQVVIRPLSGYGDNIESVNVYNNAVIAYFDRAKLGLSVDEVQRFLQSLIPAPIKIVNYKAVRIIVQNVNLNSQQVFQSEYQNGKVLDQKASMIQLNYQIESRFSKACFAACP